MNNRLPKHILIETTTHCNLNCEYCVLKTHREQRSTMTLASFKTLAAYFPHFDSVLLSGLAEPLMNKDIADFIDCVKRVNPKCIVRIISNAMFLSKNMAEKLIESGLDSFGFSIDSADPSVNNTIRKGADLFKIIGNVKNLIRIRDSQHLRKPVITATTVLQRKNFLGFSQIVKKMSEIGVEILVVNGLEPYSKTLTNQVLWGSENISPELHDTLNNGLSIARQNNITIRMNDFFPQEKKCNSINMPIVLPSGDVSACSVLSYDRQSFYEIDNNYQIYTTNGKNKRKIFGNIFRESLEGIWNNKSYTDFRKRIANKKFPDECRGCLMKYGIICATHANPPEKILNDIQDKIIKRME